MLNRLKKVLNGKSQVRRDVDLLYGCSHINIMMKALAQTLRGGKVNYSELGSFCRGQAEMDDDIQKVTW